MSPNAVISVLCGTQLRQTHEEFPCFELITRASMRTPSSNIIFIFRGRAILLTFRLKVHLKRTVRFAEQIHTEHDEFRFKIAIEFK